MKVESQLVGTGKLGNVVYSNTAGGCVTRAYKSSIANPSTPKQVNQRARLKLMSQLAADMAPVIAIPKKGNVSARNQFISKNFDFSYASDGQASITLENVQLTDGRTGLPGVAITRVADTKVTAELAETADASISRVVYNVYKKTSEKALQLMDSAVVTEAGEDGKFSKDFSYISGEIMIYAYGMRDMNASATAKYNNMVVANGTDIASLVATRSLSSSDYQFTETRATTLASNENESVTVPEGSARVYVTASGPGTVSGGGTFTIGSSVTVVATPNTNANFLGWKVNGQQNYISQSASYTFTLNNTADLVAVFEMPGGGDGFTQ